VVYGACVQHYQTHCSTLSVDVVSLLLGGLMHDHRPSSARLRTGGPELAGEGNACPAWGNDTANGQAFGVCCVLQPLRLEAPNGNTPLGDQLMHQAWLWCVAAMLVYLAWLLWLQRAHAVAQRVRARHNVSAADFAVWISHAGFRDADNTAIEELGRHYGKVILATNVLTLGRVLSKCAEVGPQHPPLPAAAVLA
jgi:HAMP domain-containing protein